MMRNWMIAALLSSIPVAVSAADAPPPVTIDSGVVQGTVEDSVASWKGIPFAAPPVGALRWRAPQPVAAWSTPLNTAAYGHDCMQLPFPSDAAPLGTPPAEDCLYLNLWRPAGRPRKLPVIVWIYGGGFVNGGASPPTYSGAALARQGALFVSFNYRLGRFGTFAHPQLSREDADNGLLGNYGYLDQIAALRWVQRNVAAFGGDPGNVTIIGESAGGMSVHALVTSPMAKGLFHKAVALSGGDGGGMASATLASVEQIGVDFAQSKGIARDDPQALARLRALSPEDVVSGLNLTALFAASGPRTFAAPFADGTIAVDAGKAYATGAFAHVPMMIGATSDDIGGKTGAMVAGARSVAATIADTGVPVYAYRFSYVAGSARAPGTAGASHASDIPFFFHTENIKYGAATSARDIAMGATISGYLVRFAKSGSPDAPGRANWPRYARSADRILDFAADGQAVPEKDPWGAEIDAAARRLAKP